MLGYLSQAAENFLFDRKRKSTNRPLNLIIRILRFPYAVLRDVASGDHTLRAMSLVYTTLLSIVPLLAFSFSVLKGFGYHREKFEPLLQQFFEPLGPRGAELTQNIIGFVDNVKGTVLGTLGLVFLIYTVISMIQKVEDSFNYVWQVEKPRSFARRFSEYVSVLLIGPVLMFTAMTILGSLSSSKFISWLSGIEPFGTTIVTLAKLTPFIIVTFVFSFVYAFVPNTRVKAGAAIVGGATAGIIWATTGKIFAGIVAASTRYTAIYSGFAIVILALIWLYISWLILLLGAQIAFYFQNPEFLRTGRSRIELTGLLREKLALATMYLIAEAYHEGNSTWTVNKLASHFGIPSNALASVTSNLESAGLLVATEDDRLMPGRALDTIKLVDVVQAVRGSVTEIPARSVAATIDQLSAEVDASVRNCLGKRTLRDIIDGNLSAEAS